MQRTSHVIVYLALGYLLLLIGCWVVFRVTGQRGGLPGIVQIFALYLFVPVLLIVPVAVLGTTGMVRTIFVLAAVGYGARFLPGLVALPVHPTVGAMRITVMSWNVLWSNPDTSGIIERVRSSPADIVALQELTAKQRRMLYASTSVTQRYPYGRAIDGIGSEGIALLSSYPMLGAGTLQFPPIVWARLDLGQGRTLLMVTAHPVLYGPRLEHFDPGPRDEQIRIVRANIQPLLRRAEPWVLVGDFNVTEREPAYRELAHGLIDAHRRAGIGPGFTWRSLQLRALPFGLLRIDYVLSSPDLKPLHTRVDCSQHASDHCAIEGVLEYPLRRSPT